MKKKCTVLQKDLEDQKDEQKGLQDKEKLYHQQIRALEKEVAAHKKEIKARDVVIGEKEKRIYELKKKNQELDKFKFVLDFKIRELKRQIEPRQQEIAAMKDQIRDMDAELEKYHTSNSALDELIGSLREQIDTTLKETAKKRMQAKTQENNISAFKSDVQMTIAHILDPQALYTAVEKLVQTHDTQGKVKPTIDPELESEYSRHRQFLERSIKQMQKVLADETLAHQDVNMKLMRNNLDLIGEINAQRDDNKTLRQAIQAEMGRLNALGRSFASGKVPNKRMIGAKSDASFPMTAVEEDERDQPHVDPVKMLEKNRRRMMAIRGCIGELEDRVGSMKQVPAQLPPMDSADDLK